VQSARKALKNMEEFKTREVQSLYAEAVQQDNDHVVVPVVYTPHEGKRRPYKDSPIPYLNAPLFRQAVRSNNCMFYTTHNLI